MTTVRPTTRPATPQDETFLADLFHEVHRPEFAPLALPEPQLATLLALQSRAQRIGYATDYPLAIDRIVLDESGTPIGRILVHSGPNSIHLIDIALLAHARGKGLGTALLQQLIADSYRSALPIRLMVRPENPAVALYTRLGFRHTGGQASLKMEFSPAESLERAFTSYGVPFRIRTSSPELLAALPSVLPHHTEPLPRGDESAELFTLLSADQPALDQLKQDLMIHVANLAPDHVFVHAGVVGWRGRAILLPGTSFAGKTTLTAALVRAGATYYSDEYAVLDSTGQVHPYARDLQVRQPGESAQTALPVQQLAGVAGTEPLAAALVVFAQYRPGAHWNPQPVSPGLAVLEMLRHAIPVQRTPARVMATLTALMESATACSSERDEADTTAAALLAAFDRP